MTLNVTIKNISTNGKQAVVMETTTVQVTTPEGIQATTEHDGIPIVIGENAEVEFVIHGTNYLTIEEN